MVDKDGRRKVVLDFKAVEYLSSAALGKLVSLEKKMNLAKGKLVLCNIRKDIYEVFKLLQLGKVLTICSDLDEAAWEVLTLAVAVWRFSERGGLTAWRILFSSRY